MKKKLLSFALLASLIIASFPVNANWISGQTLTYDKSWGSNLPQSIRLSEKTSSKLDVLVVEYKKEGGYYDGNKFLPDGSIAFLNVLSNLSEITGNGKTYSKLVGNDFKKKIYDPYIEAIRTPDGKKLNITNDLWSDCLDKVIDAYQNADIGDVFLTAEVKVNPLGLDKYLQIREVADYKLINTSTIQPGLTGSLSESITGGVSKSDSYSFAKTIGSSDSISVGAQLGNSNVGGVSGSYTRTMSQEVTKVHGTSLTISDEQTKSIDISRTNATDKVEVLGLYQRNFGYTMEYVDDVYAKYGKESKFKHLKNGLNGYSLHHKDCDSYEPLSCNIAPSYTYKDVYYETVLGVVDNDSVITQPVTPTPATHSISIKPSQSTYVKWGSNMKHVYNQPNACYIYKSNANSKNSQTGFLKFNLKPIIGKKIVSAKLEYTISVNGSTVISIVEDIDASNWAESRLNGNEAKHFDDHNTVVKSKKITSSGRYSEDVKSIIQDFAYRGDSDDYLTFRISQPSHSTWTSVAGRTSKNPPKLIIEYQN